MDKLKDIKSAAQQAQMIASWNELDNNPNIKILSKEETKKILSESVYERFDYFGNIK